MSWIDPTDLRCIVDSFDSQSIQLGNIASLPHGLLGVYEEALPWEQNIQQKGKLLAFFSVWALLKKVFSTDFVSNLLSSSVEKVIDETAVYTQWLNCPTSDTYILYLKRLRAYLHKKITYKLEMVKWNNTEKAFKCAFCISDVSKIIGLSDIYIELVKQNRIVESIGHWISSLNFPRNKSEINHTNKSFLILIQQ